MGAISFAGRSVHLTLGDGSHLTNTRSNISQGDAIDLFGLAYQGGATATVSGSTLTATSGGSSRQFTLANLSATFSDRANHLIDEKSLQISELSIWPNRNSCSVVAKG